MATVTLEGRRCYISTSYGESCVPKLKSLGAHWDADSRRWWISSAKRAEVEKIVAGSTVPSTSDRKPESPSSVMVKGKARYKDRSYYVRWSGMTKKGDQKFRLTTLDGKIDFWADAALCQWEKCYEEEMSLGSIQRFVDRRKAEGSSSSTGTSSHSYSASPRGQRTGCSCGSIEGEVQESDCWTCKFDEQDG